MTQLNRNKSIQSNQKVIKYVPKGANVKFRPSTRKKETSTTHTIKKKFKKKKEKIDDEDDERIKWHQ